MNDPRLDFERQRYQAFRTALLAQDPTLDERTLADTLEGLTDFTDMLKHTIRAALKDETEAAVLACMIDEMKERQERFCNRANYRREKVRDAMLNADIKSLVAPDFTASLRNAPPHVVVVDEALIPKQFFEMRPHLLKRDLLGALKDGAQIDGAALSNAAMSLSIRTR
jgi:hypothetical protein